ncbi:MAG TPA: hypothetical protein VK507_09295 [Iamia sp.]|nr:hypothetical protein [Iamia sp.]
MGRQVDLDDLVDTLAIADRLGMSDTTAVLNLVRRHPEFPRPVAHFGGRVRVWLWPDVEAWAKATGRLR